jgi:AraC-like DNA-binding protein
MLFDGFDHKAMIDFTYRADNPIEPIFHSHSFYEVYYFHQGRCNYLIGDKIYALAPGDLILMYGMTLHCPKIDPSVPYIRSIVHFEPAVLAPFLGHPQAVNVLQPFKELRNHRLSLTGDDRNEVERILAFMNEQQSRGDRIGANRIMLAFADLLYVIYEHCLQPLSGRNEQPSEKEKTVQAIVSYLETNYAEELHLDHLQEHLHLSKYYLAKLFKEVTGVTVFDFIYRHRINQARILFLLDPKISVTEVCFRSGFKHLAHFSRLFKQYVGIPPGKYKRQAIDESSPERSSSDSQSNRDSKSICDSGSNFMLNSNLPSNPNPNPDGGIPT